MRQTPWCALFVAQHPCISSTLIDKRGRDSEDGWMATLISLATAVIASGFTLPLVCNLLGLNAPTLKKSMIASAVVGAVAFFSFDLLGYGLVLGTRDMTSVTLPPGYSYMNWLGDPLYLKWQMMGLVPLLRYLPVILAIVLGGTLYVFVLLEPFRQSTVVFVGQWVLNILAVAAVNFVLGKTQEFTNRPDLPSPTVGQPGFPQGGSPQSGFPQGFPQGYPQMTQSQYQRAMTRPSQQPYLQQQGKGKAAKQIKQDGAEAKGLAQVLSEQQTKLGPFFAKINDGLHDLTQHLDPYLEPVREATQPFTQYLPLGVQEFLDDGGWWLVLTALAVLFLLWGRRMVRRIRRVLKRRRKQKKETIKKMRIELEEVGDAFTEAGPRQIRVGNFTGRLRVVVLAPSASFVGELLPEMAENLLDYLLPGLGEIIESDQPKVTVWQRQSSESQFAGLFKTLVQAPETSGRPSPWVLVSGSLRMGRQTLFVGLAVFMDRIQHRREIQVEKADWESVIGLEKSTEQVG